MMDVLVRYGFHHITSLVDHTKELVDHRGVLVGPLGSVGLSPQRSMTVFRRHMATKTPSRSSPDPCDVDLGCEERRMEVTAL